MDLLCPLTEVKLANAGRYSCAVKYEDQQEISQVKILKVKGVFAIIETVLPIGD